MTGVRVLLDLDTPPNGMPWLIVDGRVIVGQARTYGLAATQAEFLRALNDDTDAMATK